MYYSYLPVINFNSIQNIIKIDIKLLNCNFLMKLQFIISFHINIKIKIFIYSRN